MERLRNAALGLGGAMAMIIRASESVAEVPPGFPILLDNAMAILEPAFAFLIELATIPGRSHAVETVRTYGEHLHDWFDSLEQSELDWREIDIGVVAAYRNRMLEGVSPHTKRPYARSTINDRIRTVCRFYEWARRRGWISAVPFYFEDVRVSGKAPFLAHLDHRPGVVRANVLTVSRSEALPRPLRVAELRCFLDQLRGPYRLIGEWALATGMRRKELCGLVVGQIPNSAPLHMETDPLVSVGLTVTKGDRPRVVYPPLRLIDRTGWYIGEDRAALIKRLRRGDLAYRAPASLFLNAHGAPISRARLTAVFTKAFVAAGLKGSPHRLRHTFAMTMLTALQARARENPLINPLKVVQLLLGHASIQSTAIYLRCVELHGRELAESIDYLYGALIDA